MKSLVKYSTTILFLLFAFLYNTSFAQNENEPQNKSYVKIKTMKIVNGDTIVTEKEYSGNGDMDIEDTLSGEGFGNFQFHQFNNLNDSSFYNHFSNMENIFKNLNFGSNNFLFNNFDFPGFNRGFDVDSIIKEFNFNNPDTTFPSLGDNKIIIKNYKEDNNKNSNDSLNLNKKNQNMDVQVYGKNEKGQPITYSKKIIILDKGINTSKQSKEELQIDIFPNPAENYFNISFQLDQKNKTNIVISDLNGKEFQNEIIEQTSGLYTRQFDMKNYAKGTYLINIKQGKKSTSRKIIIE